MSEIVIVGIVLIVAGVLFAAGYNALIKASIQVKEAWAQIEVQLKRRYDLIPNLIATVKGYAAHEAGTFQKVTEARANAINATTPKEQAQAENMLSGALKSLFAVSESYPDLKASQNFLSLQEELSTTENKIAFSRQYYNDSVQKLNTLRSTFPLLLIKKITQPAEFFQGEEENKTVPEVKF